MSGEPRPAYKLPPTWDNQVDVTPGGIEDRRNGDIRAYLRPLRRLPRPVAGPAHEPDQVPEVPEEEAQGPEVPALAQEVNLKRKVCKTRTILVLIWDLKHQGWLWEGGFEFVMRQPSTQPLG